MVHSKGTRLVCFSQLLGVDYGDIYSLVVKSTTIHTILSYALSKNWTNYQLDVKNAFP